MNKIKEVLIGVCQETITICKKTFDIATLKQEVKYLRKENEELRLKERPYIDKITKLQSENRILKIQNTKLKKKLEILGDKENDF